MKLSDDRKLYHLFKMDLRYVLTFVRVKFDGFSWNSWKLLGLLRSHSQVTSHNTSKLINRLGFTDEYKSLTATVNNQIGADSAAIKVLAGLTPSRDDNIHH